MATIGYRVRTEALKKSWGVVEPNVRENEQHEHLQHSDIRQPSGVLRPGPDDRFQWSALGFAWSSECTIERWRNSNWSCTGGGAGAEPESIERSDANTPTGRQIKVFVFGDSLGDGMAYGLNQAFKGDKSVKIARMSRASTGFVRDDFYNWNAALPAILEKEEMDIAIVMIGSNDRQTMRLSGGGQKFGTPEFLKNYTERVDRFMKAFAGRGIAVYWLGMPVTRGPKHSAAMKVLNGIYRERAEANDIAFIPTWRNLPAKTVSLSSTVPM